MAKTVEEVVEKLRSELNFGIDPAKLDPFIAMALEATGKLLAVINSKSSASVSGMSIGDLSKSVINLQKALDGLSRLRNAASGGKDESETTFILQIVRPDADKVQPAPDPR